jgi:serine/threonine protein kinase/Tol biopolymer transport system component
MSSPFKSGTKLGRYELRSKLGAGGMGVVYLAKDTKLGRKVALKILHAELAGHSDRMNRFVQEARAASGLNHPNILTIHEIDRLDSTYFIATELIEGKTLREHMRKTSIRLGEVLDINIQVASALDAAHAAGIVHRDIKPENIMLRSDGIAKVLDFGLAKLLDAGDIDPDAETRGLVKTDPGTVIGTSRYMSPEQVRGLDLDARTDIWSLGVVIYEMLTGGLPFIGETKSHTMVAILEREPVTVFAGAPAELQRIVRKALTKDRDNRYQTARDLLIDLKNLRRDLDLQSEIERSVAPNMSATGAIAPATSFLVNPLWRDSVATNQTISDGLATQDVRALHTSSAEYLVRKIKRHKTAAFIALVSILLLGVAVVCAGYRLVFRAPSTIAHFQNISIRKLTTLGSVSDVVISPDGKYVVYDLTEYNQQGLWTKYLPTGSTVPIVPPAEVLGLGATTFSRDGNFVYYVRRDQNNPSGSLFKVPVLGGTPKRVMDNVRSPISFSPDGNQFVFVKTPDSHTTQLVIANADGTNERELAELSSSEWFSVNGPSWSPDGKLIACGTGSTRGGMNMTVSAVSVDSGAIKPLTPPQWSGVNRVAWFADGSGLAFLASPPLTSDRQIWQLSYPSGAVRRITNDLNRYGDASLGITADSSMLVSMQATTGADIWLAPSDAGAQARQITSRNQQQNGARGISWVSDGQIVYGSYASGNADIWIMNADGSNQKQLTDHPQADENPFVSRDGRYVVFQSLRTGNWNMWRMDLDGGNLKQLTKGNNDNDPSITPDGQWVVYCDREDKQTTIWKVSIEGGAPMRVAGTTQAMSPSVSPDGKQLAYIEVTQKAKSPFQLVVISLETGAPLKSFDIPVLASDRLLRWTPDGRDLVYLGRATGVGLASVWRQPLDGSGPVRFLDFKPDSIFSFAFSQDGKQIALSRGRLTRDAVLINDVK